MGTAVPVLWGAPSNGRPGAPSVVLLLLALPGTPIAGEEHPEAARPRALHPGGKGSQPPWGNSLTESTGGLGAGREHEPHHSRRTWGHSAASVWGNLGSEGELVLVWGAGGFYAMQSSGVCS